MATGGNPLEETKVPVIITAICICCTVATTLTAMRIYVRHHLLHHLGKDDYLVIAALVVLWVNGALGLWATKHGFGRPEADSIREGVDRRPLLYLGIFGPISYHISSAIIQNSLLTFYNRLRFTRSSLFIHIFSILLRVLSVINVIVPICFIITIYTIPDPRAFYYTFCIMWYVNGSLALFIDLAIWSLPLPTLTRLENVRGRKRVALIATFSIGLVGCAATAVRLVMLEKIVTGGGEEDIYFGPGVTLHIMSMTEVGVGVVCACMATLRPLMSKWGVFSSRAEGSGRKSVQGIRGWTGRCVCGNKRGHSGSCKIRRQSGIGGKFSRGTGVEGSVFTGNTVESSFSCTITGEGSREEGVPGGPGGGSLATELEFAERRHFQETEVENYNVCVPDIELPCYTTSTTTTTVTSSPSTTNKNHTRSHLEILRTLTIETRCDMNPQHRSESTTSLTAVPVNEGAHGHAQSTVSSASSLV